MNLKSKGKKRGRNPRRRHSKKMSEEENSSFPRLDGDFDVRCGEIYLNREGVMAFLCTFCEKIYESFEKYVLHIEDHQGISNSMEFDESFSTCENTENSEHFLQYEDIKSEENVNDLVIEDKIVIDQKSITDGDIDEIKYEETETIEESIVRNEYIEYDIEDDENVVSINFELLNEAQTSEITKQAKESFLTESLRPVDVSTDKNEYHEIRKNTKNYHKPKNKMLNKTEEQFLSETPVNTSAAKTEFRELRKKTNYFPNPNEIRPYKCPFCESTFKDRGNFQKHKARHNTKKNHPCPICHKMFYDAENLRKHQKFHSNVCRHLCNICGKTFSAANYLKDHLRRHTNQRNYKCSICEKRFFNSSILKEHILTHQNTRSFECNICDARFNNKKGLKNHTKLHANKREYKCNLCGADFNQAAGLFNHKKTKHRMK